MEDNLVPVTGIQNEIFTPKSYKVRTGTSDSGKDYERKVTAVLALKCCSEELEHFWLAANVDGFGALDDIIMFKKSKANDHGITYCMQLKHQDAPKPIVKDMFLADRGDFSVNKYYECYTKMQCAINDETKQSDMIRHFRQNNDMVFIIFTNKETNYYQFLYKVNDTSHLCALQLEGDIFKFDHSTFPDLNVNFLNSLFLFAQQSPITDMDNKVQTAIKDLLWPLELSDVALRDIAQKFVSFVGKWSKGFLGGHYPLTKTYIIRKLTELLLFPFMLKVEEREHPNNYRVENEEVGAKESLWYNFTRDKDVTIIDDIDDMSQRYVNDCTYSILSNLNIVTAINSKLLLRVVSNRENMSKSDRYELLWKTREIPLLLQVSDEQGVRDIQQILNVFAGVFRIIILNKTQFPLENIYASNIFTNITDLNEEQQQQILQIPVKLQGRELLAIQTLNIEQGNFYESLKVKDIVQILSSQFNIGSQFEKLPAIFVPMSLSTIMLDITVLKQVPQNIFVVKCESVIDFESFLIYQLTINAREIIQWEVLNRNNFEGRIIIFNLTYNLQEIEEFCQTLQKTVHFLVWHDKDNLEWIKSNNAIENLRKYVKPSESTATESILAEEALTNFCQNKKLLLISANPGMGKSVLIKYFAHNVPINLCVLKINLPKYKDHYKKWDTQTCNSQEFRQEYFKQFLKQVLKEQQISNSMVFDSVFEEYLNSKRVVFLLDGFDEIQINCQSGAKKLIKFINESGYYGCVTTRPVLKKDLESVLNTFAVTLNNFSIDDQTYFLTNYFANIGNVMPSNSRVISFVAKLLDAARTNLNDVNNRFTGIPLQTTLLAAAFVNDFIKYLYDGIFRNQYFDLIYLYRHFLKENIKIASIKAETIPEDMIFLYKKCRSFYALRRLFSDGDLEQLKIEEQLKAVTELFPHTMQIIQKDGITLTDSQSNVSFIHQTYAEFLVADWLSENVNTSDKVTVQKLLMKIFKLNFLVLQNMFDRFMAMNCPLHIAIINRQINTVKKIINSEENAMSTTDDGGRTALHLIAAWGLHHPHPFSDCITYKMIREDCMMTILKLIPNNKLIHVEDGLLNYTPLDYAVLRRSLSIADRFCSKIKNPKCCIDIFQSEADTVLGYVDEHYCISLYMVILRCRIRTEFELQNEHDNGNVHCAISRGTIEKVRSLISRKNINLQDSNGCTPLHTAAKYGHTEITMYLLSRKANINRIDNLGRSALHWASYHGHFDIVSLLITNKVKVDTTDCYNRTALHYAFISSSSTNKYDIVSKLIESSTGETSHFINIKDTYSMNALHWAAQNGQIDVINLMVSKKVDVTVKGIKNMTALLFAVQNNHPDIINLLLINGAEIEAKNIHNQTPLHLAALKGHHDVIGVLLTKGSDIEAKDEHNQTPLHLAALKGYTKVVSVLLNNGAEIEAKNSFNETPLHLAALKGHHDVIGVLLTNGSEIEAKDKNNQTPLHLAAFWGHEATVNLLVTKGADIQANCRKQRTPFDMAVAEGHEDIASFFLTNRADNNCN